MVRVAVGDGFGDRVGDCLRVRSIKLFGRLRRLGPLPLVVSVAALGQMLAEGVQHPTSHQTGNGRPCDKYNVHPQKRTGPTRSKGESSSSIVFPHGNPNSYPVHSRRPDAVL